MTSYPKSHYMDTVRALQGNMNVSNTGTAPFIAAFFNNTNCLVAPSRYSNVQKVVFSLCTGKLGAGTTTDCRLRVATWSSTTPAITVEQFALAPSSFVQGITQAGFVGTNKLAFAGLGATTTIVQANVSAGERDHGQLLEITYDRALPGDADFFTAWDAFTDDDDYMCLHPVVDVVTGDGSPMSMRFKTFQCTVLQDADAANNTCTDWPSYIGVRDDLEGTTAYQGAVFGPRMPFHFIAADWDGIDSITAVVFGSHGGGVTVFVQVFNITTATQVFEETFDVTGGGNFHVVRTQDFSGSLVDGNLYRIDYRLNAASSSTIPRGSGFFSLVQKSFTRTVCTHHLSGLDFTPTGHPEVSMGAILFDPDWYDGVVVNDSKVFSAFIHNDNANDARQGLRVDTDLLIDDSSEGSGTAVALTPSHTFTGAPSSEGKYLLTAILTNDPRDLSVKTRLQKSFLTGGLWLGGIGDFPGHMGLYYALGVSSSSQGLGQFGGRSDPDLDLSDIGPI